MTVLSSLSICSWICFICSSTLLGKRICRLGHHTIGLESHDQYHVTPIFLFSTRAVSNFNSLSSAFPVAYCPTEVQSILIMNAWKLWDREGIYPRCMSKLTWQICILRTAPSASTRGPKERCDGTESMPCICPDGSYSCLGIMHKLCLFLIHLLLDG